MPTSFPAQSTTPASTVAQATSAMRFGTVGFRPDYDELVEALHDVARGIELADPLAKAQLQALLHTISTHADPRCVGL